MKKSFLILLLLISCTQEETESKEQSNSEHLIELKRETTDSGNFMYKRYSNLDDVVSEESTEIKWVSENFYPNLSFSYSKGFVSFQFNGQCYIDFPFEIIDECISVRYSPIQNCKSTNFTKIDFEIIPKEGERFMQLELINDSVLQAKYFFKEWTNIANSKDPKNKPFVDKFIAKSVSR